MKAMERIAPDVGWQPISFVNAYFIGHPRRSLGTCRYRSAGAGPQIIEAAEARFGWRRTARKRFI